MKIIIKKGDITTLAVEAIVNAANSSLLGGGGVDGAIHRAAGPELLAECMKIRDRQGGCKTGHAVITGAGKLAADYVIHTVGPVWNGGNKNERELLRSCYAACLKHCVDNGIRRVAIPNISTGIYRFPKEKACGIALDAVQNFENKNALDEVIFVCYDQENYTLYQNALKKD